MSKSRVNPVTVINGRLICTSTSGFITPDGAAATINRLTAEVERLGVYEPKIDLRSSPTDMRVHVAKEAMRNLVVAFSEFNRCGNYTETQVEYEGESFLVTVQNLNRPTPHDLRKKAEQQLTAVTAERDELKRIVDRCTKTTADGKLVGWGDKIYPLHPMLMGDPENPNDPANKDPDHAVLKCIICDHWSGEEYDIEYEGMSVNTCYSTPESAQAAREELESKENK